MTSNEKSKLIIAILPIGTDHVVTREAALSLLRDYCRQWNFGHEELLDYIGSGDMLNIKITWQKNMKEHVFSIYATERNIAMIRLKAAMIHTQMPQAEAGDTISAEILTRRRRRSMSCTIDLTTTHQCTLGNV